MILIRCEFIKYSGIVVGVLVVILVVLFFVWVEEKGGKIFIVGCWGVMNVEVKDGKIVFLIGVLVKIILNFLQFMAVDQVYIMVCIQYLMVRKSYFDNLL